MSITAQMASPLKTQLKSSLRESPGRGTRVTMATQMSPSRLAAGQAAKKCHIDRMSGPDPVDTYFAFALLAQDWNLHHFNTRAIEKGYSGVHNFLAVSTNLPHIHLEIGPVRDTQDTAQGTLKAMCDTGAGLNIGNKAYHKSCRERAPHLVSRYIDFATKGFDPIVVGSVDADSVDRLEITAIITYFMPFQVDAHPTTISFGLAERVATNTIIGHPCFKTMRATIDYNHNTVFMARIGASFVMFDDVPTQSAVAPSNGAGGNPQSFAALPQSTPTTDHFRQ
jgi:hypothetical protein